MRRGQTPSFARTASKGMPSTRPSAARRRSRIGSLLSRCAVSESETISCQRSMGTMTPPASAFRVEGRMMLRLRITVGEVVLSGEVGPEARHRPEGMAGDAALLLHGWRRALHHPAEVGAAPVRVAGGAEVARESVRERLNLEVGAALTSGFLDGAAGEAVRAAVERAAALGGGAGPGAGGGGGAVGAAVGAAWGGRGGKAGGSGGGERGGGEAAAGPGAAAARARRAGSAGDAGATPVLYLRAAPLPFYEASAPFEEIKSPPERLARCARSRPTRRARNGCAAILRLSGRRATRGTRSRRKRWACRRPRWRRRNATLRRHAGPPVAVPADFDSARTALENLGLLAPAGGRPTGSSRCIAGRPRLLPGRARWRLFGARMGMPRPTGAGGSTWCRRVGSRTSSSFSRLDTVVPSRRGPGGGFDSHALPPIKSMK
jgi:hypothetical protein